MVRILLGVFLLVLTPSIGAQRIYRFYNPGDWVSFTNTRYVTGIARGFNTIFFATTGGILRYDIISERWLDPLTVSDGMPDNRVRRLAVDRMTDELWIETPNGAANFNPTFEEWSNIITFPSELVQSSNYEGQGLPQFFTPVGYTFFSPNLLTDRDMFEYRITQFLREDNSRVWMGVWGLGPALGDLAINDLALMPQGPYDDDVADLDRDGDEMWFLGGGEGLPGSISYYDRSSDHWEYFDARRNRGIISDQFYSIAHDRKAVWIGTELGLVRMDRRSRNFESYSQFDGISGERVTALKSIKNNLLIGTDDGISIFDHVRDTIYSANTDLTKGLIVFDFDTRDSMVFAATEIGVLSLNWGGSTWKRILLDSPYLRAPVYDIQVVDTLLYTVGEDGVVVVNLKDYSYTYHDRATAFRNAQLTSLLVHGGTVWVGGGDGLFRYNRRKDSWYRYTTSDGLVSLRVRSLVADGDYLWIGTDRGATRFYWNDKNRSDWLQ